MMGAAPAARQELAGDDQAHALDATAARPAEGAARYLVNSTRLLHDDRALAEALPIATGVIEDACRHLVEDRMGRTGARWSAAGAEAILRLRALRASGDFDDYWGVSSGEGARAHTSVTLRRQGRAQPAAATSAKAEAGQVIVFASVEPRHKRAAPVNKATHTCMLVAFRLLCSLPCIPISPPMYDRRPRRIVGGVTFAAVRVQALSAGHGRSR
jgi:hypothetical protein